MPMLVIQKSKSRLCYINIFQTCMKPLVLAGSRDFRVVAPCCREASWDSKRAVSVVSRAGFLDESLQQPGRVFSVCGAALRDRTAQPRPLTAQPWSGNVPAAAGAPLRDTNRSGAGRCLPPSVHH